MQPLRPRSVGKEKPAKYCQMSKYSSRLASPVRSQALLAVLQVDRARARADAPSYWSAPVTGNLLAAIVAIPCVTALIMLGMVLHFSKVMVEKSGDTKCLRDVAVLLRAFGAGPGGLLSTVAKIWKRS
jgi:hypothetical protein